MHTAANTNGEESRSVPTAGFVVLAVVVVAPAIVVVVAPPIVVVVAPATVVVVAPPAVVVVAPPAVVVTTVVPGMRVVFDVELPHVPTLLTVLASRLTAAFIANNAPFTVVLAPTLAAVAAMMLPLKVFVPPKVAEVPIVQYTPQARALFVNTTAAPPEVVKVVPV